MKGIWIHDHKNEIIYDLKNMISDLEDEHHSTPAFFYWVLKRVEKWKALEQLDMKRSNPK